MMEDEQFLEAWLHNLNIVLEDTKKNIAKIEDNEENNRRFEEIQVSLMKKWLKEDTLSPKAREDLEGILTNVENREQENKERLERLKVVEESTSFLVKKIKEEQNT